eukprot:TRINITY_DN27174_c0_g2_i1.p1 TRINITY_DN27174_c0_g2~~TRINITY_DN27174_c0_g2_i1.p1  ORF type:complete len:1028 (+),score=149.88 TRINITY_DN27174_c0_g2_i1:223-3084(+)
MSEEVGLGLCLWWHNVELASWIDTADEVLYDQDLQAIPFEGRRTQPNLAFSRIETNYDNEKLSLLQCLMIVTGLKTEELDLVHGMYGKSQRWFKNIACTPGGIMFPELTGSLMMTSNGYQKEPIFGKDVFTAIQECFLSDAFDTLWRHQRHAVEVLGEETAGEASRALPNSPAELGQEWMNPLPGHGQAYERLSKGGHAVCVFVLTTTASEKHQADAQAVLETWASPENRVEGVEVFMIEDNSWQTFRTGRGDLSDDLHLTLRGDVDLGFLYNGVRALYLWRYLASHHAEHCGWFVKVDADTFVNPVALKLRLNRYFNASDAVYLGSSKSTTLGSGRKLKFAVNAILLSSGLLQQARKWFEVCVSDLISRRLGKGAEDMDLAYCLDLHGALTVKPLGVRTEMPSRNMASVANDGEGEKLLSLAGLCTLFIHPVHAEEMPKVHKELLRLASLNASSSGPNTSCDWPEAGDADVVFGNAWGKYMARYYQVDDNHICWSGQFTWDTCCHPRWGPGGNTMCWDDENSWQRCCNRTQKDFGAGRGAGGTKPNSTSAGNRMENDSSSTSFVSPKTMSETSASDAPYHTQTVYINEPLRNHSLSCATNISDLKHCENANSETVSLFAEQPILPAILPLSNAEPTSLGNPKCWTEEGFTYELCCEGPKDVAQQCWVWPFNQIFCCQAPLPPRPPLRVGGATHSSSGAASAGRRTHRCPEPQDRQQGFLACEKSLDEIGALFELSVIGSGDKASGWHDYLGAYERLLLHLPLSANVLELGVRMGSSLAMWSEYFPLGMVVGVDKNLGTFMTKGQPLLQQHGAFGRGNVQVLQANASDVSALQVLLDAGISEHFADVIVDDANHWARDQIARFELYFPSVLRPGGVYIIEDVHIQAPYAHDGTAVRAYFSNLSAFAYLTESEILVGAHQIHAVRNASQNWRHKVESVTLMRDMVAIVKAENTY